MLNIFKNLLEKSRNEKVVRNAIDKFLQNTNKTGLTCGINKENWSLFLKKRIHRNYHEIATEFAWQKGVINFKWEEFRISMEYLQMN